MLRPKYPKLRAFLYSPPGGVCSLPVVEYTKQFATGILLGHDGFSRLGVVQMERLRYQTLLAIKETRRSTGAVLARALLPSCCFSDETVEYVPGQSVDLLHSRACNSFEFQNKEIPFQKESVLLLLPGRLIHILLNHQVKLPRSNDRGGAIYQAIWSEDNSAYDRIIVSEGMVWDHLPTSLMNAMKGLLTRTLPGRRDYAQNNEMHARRRQTPSAINQEAASASSPNANGAHCGAPEACVPDLGEDNHGLASLKVGQDMYPSLGQMGAQGGGQGGQAEN